MTPNTPRAHWLGSTLAMGAAAGIVLVVSAVLHARVDDLSDRPGRAPLPVTLTTFIEQDGYHRDQQFLGLVRAGTHSQVGFDIPGTIHSIAVREGDSVRAGTPLAVLDQRALNARLAAAHSRVEQRASELELARGRAQRQEPLQKTGAISAQAFDDTRLAERAAAAGLAAAQAELRVLEVEREKSTLRAPYDAVVGRQFLDTGAVTGPGIPLFTLIATAEREAHIGIAVEQAETVAPGSHYPLLWRGERIDATLRAVRPDVNPVSLTTVAIFELPAQVPAFDGEPVSVSLPWRVQERGGWLPLAALLEGERGIWTVLRATEDGTSLRTVREVVQVLHVREDEAYVSGTLSDGDLVIADGVHRVAPGTLVRRAES